MADTYEPAPVWRFGAFEVVARTGELRRNGVVVHLQEQPARLLVYLLEHAGQIVTRDDLRIHLWPADTFVDFDHALNTAVMKLREALGDSSEKPLYIHTIPRKGYRFVAPVAAMPPSSGPPSPVRASAAAPVSASPGSGGPLEMADPHQSGAPLSPTPAKEPHAIPPNPPAAVPQDRSQNTLRNATRLITLTAVLLFLALAGALLYKTSKSAVAPARSLTRITFDEGLQTDPTWSSDGRYIAYTAVRDGAAHIWIQQISTGVPVQVTSGPGPDSQPDWSPDGKYIAYRSGAGEGGLFIIPALGGAGQERRIATVGYNPRWSPDSSQILFHGGRSPWRGVSELYVVGLDGGQPQQVLAAFFKQHQAIHPISAVWHPDGKRITVWAEKSFMLEEPTPSFWTVPLHGGPAVSSEIGPEVEARFRELAPPRGREWVVDSTFAWAPSGKALYMERTFRGARSLWRLNIDPTTLRATSVDQLTSSGGLDTGPAVSPDGKRLAFTAGSGKVSAWVYPFDANRGRITGAGRPVTSPGINAWQASMSSDGSKLVFLGVRAGETGLWLKPLPQGRELPLFDDHYYRDTPQWSPDGTRLAYIRISPNRDEEQFMMWSAETHREEPLTAWHSVGEQWEFIYDWTPDGKSLLISKPPPAGSTRDIRDELAGQPNLAVWRVPLSAAPHAESQERMIIADPAYALYQAHQSLDGRWIVFEAVPRTRPHGVTLASPSYLFVTRVTGGPWLPIIGKGWADKPRWSPDGRTIYFLWGQGSSLDVWGIRFDPETGKTLGDPFRVTTLDDPALTIPGYVADIEISVTGKSLALTLGQLSGGIWVLDNVDR
jgi:Tol biopolymer transport system component/DNA-binding winged helix-turn-helix (wHTH) protein